MARYRGRKKRKIPPRKLHNVSSSFVRFHVLFELDDEKKKKKCEVLITKNKDLTALSNYTLDDQDWYQPKLFHASGHKAHYPKHRV